MRKITASNVSDVFKSPKVSRETAELQGYELIDEFLVDSSGFGREDETALAASGLERNLTELVKEHGQVFTGLTDVGMFQVQVGIFKKAKKSILKSIDTGHNSRYGGSVHVKEREEGTKRIIRLYDTDIVEFDGRSVTLNSGGWHTKTTKAAINAVAGGKFRLWNEGQGKWFVGTNRRKMAMPFVDGMTFSV